MGKMNTARRHWKWGLLVVLAFALTFSWGHGVSQRTAAQETSQINITKQDSITFEVIGGACFEVRQLALTFVICDNDAQGGPASNPTLCVPDGICDDEDPADGLIRVTVAPGSYIVTETKAPPFYNPDPSTPACFAQPGGKCGLVFLNDSTLSRVDISKVGSYRPPGACFEVRDPAQTPLFVVCDNDSQGAPDVSPFCLPDALCEDEDAAEGLISVTVDAGEYNVVETKAPVNHAPDPGKQPCSAAAGYGCELTFVNAPNNNPWFPWDINGDEAVSGLDFFELLRHFGQRKP